MRKLVLSGLVLGLGGLSAPAVQANGPAPMPMPAPVARPPLAHQMPAPGGPAMHRGAWGQRVNGRWAAGWNAPGGWNGYHRPASGYTLPSYWINPSYYISDYATYGLPAPAYGYGWSRYYDDAVLLDRRGQVYDAMRGVHWDGPDQGAPLPPPTVVHRPDGVTVVTTSTSGGTPGYYAGGYYYPGPTVTTISIQSAPRAARATGGYGDAVTYTTRPAPVVRHKRKRRTRR